jgi:pyruvate dehydrogenase E1 component alpha subunit/2-oxoisovalerate dehydrogenase E1 component alpha subunit
VANNQYAYSTPTARQFACADLVDRAAGYGVTGHKADGTDLADCLRVVQHAVDLARDGGGPQLIVADLLRLVGHGEHDDAHYVDKALRKLPVGQDCLAVSETLMVSSGWATAAELREWRNASEEEVNAIAARVSREAAPDPNDDDWAALSDPSYADLSADA